jgi:putative hydrolase
MDFQMHTTWTDGQSSVAEMIAAARAKSLRAIAITEHVNGQSDGYPQFVAEVAAQRKHADGLEVYYGVEVAACDYRGGLKADLALHEAELVLGVVHRCPKETGGFWSFDELTASAAIELELRALAGLAGNRRIDVLGHPGGVAYKKYGAYPVEWLEPIFRTARGPVTFKINPRFSGTTAMRAHFGYNEVEMAVRDLALNEAVPIPTITEGIALRFWDETYLDVPTSPVRPAPAPASAAGATPGRASRLKTHANP